MLLSGKKQDGYSGFGELECLETGFRDWAEFKAHEVVRLLGPDCKTVLDVGCGIGTFSEKISKAGYDVTATDLENTSKKRSSKGGWKFVQSDILAPAEFSGKRFDAIVALDVLEHIGPDSKALSKMLSLLKPGGTLVLTVPAFPSLYSKLDAKIGHFRRYRPEEIRRKVRGAGFDVERVFYWNFLGLFGWALFCKLLGKSTTAAKSGISNALLGASLSVEKSAKPPIGLTLFVKARKPTGHKTTK